MLDVVPLPFKPPRLTGLTEQLLASHYENNYGGAVRRYNAITAMLSQQNPADAAGFLLNGLKREELIAANSAMLHEVYFNGLGGDGKLGESEDESLLRQAIEQDFGSMAAWQREFVALGKALSGGSGWVVLTKSARLGRLINQWAADHTQTLADGIPILALDMYEHAYHLQFGTNTAAYIDAFMANLHWQRIAQMLNAPAMSTSPTPEPAISVRELQSALQRGDNIQVLDVRLEQDFQLAKDMIAGATWKNPENVQTWGTSLPRDSEIVVHCLYGFDVGKNCARALRDLGFNARILSGGITAWHAAGGPLTALNQQ